MTITTNPQIGTPEAKIEAAARVVLQLIETRPLDAFTLESIGYAAAIIGFSANRALSGMAQAASTTQAVPAMARLA